MQPFGFGSSLLKQSLATAAGSSLLSSECREIGHSCTTFTPEPQPPLSQRGNWPLGNGTKRWLLQW